MIALIAYDTKPPTEAPNPGLACSIHTGVQPVRCTLIVVPPSLLHMWETQLSGYLRPGSLKWRRHHGSQRLTQRLQLLHYDIIITTFQTIASEWRRRHTTSSFLFSVTWYRLILDEAHYIRDRYTVSARAICAIEASRRWAMTGTPIQNRLTDFMTLVEFLKAYPYNDPKIFDGDITQLWKSKSEEAAIMRLKNLINCICLRRSNSTIDLPKRIDQVLFLDFSRKEKIKYEAAKAQTLEFLDDPMASGNSHSGSYLNVLKKINALRLICNLGLSAPYCTTEEKTVSAQPIDISWDTQEAQEAFDALVAVGQALCVKCGADMGVSGGESAAADGPTLLHLSQCGRLVCDTCLRKLEILNQPASWCGHTPSCATTLVSNAPSLYESAASTVEDVLEVGTISTKVKALVKDIQRFRDIKR